MESLLPLDTSRKKPLSLTIFFFFLFGIQVKAGRPKPGLCCPLRDPEIPSSRRTALKGSALRFSRGCGRLFGCDGSSRAGRSTLPACLAFLALPATGQYLFPFLGPPAASLPLANTPPGRTALPWGLVKAHGRGQGVASPRQRYSWGRSATDALSHSLRCPGSARPPFHIFLLPQLTAFLLESGNAPNDTAYI